MSEEAEARAAGPDTIAQAKRLLKKYGKAGAIKAADKNAFNAPSDDAEEFWERVAELIEDDAVAEG